MRNGFMAGSVTGSKKDISRANRIANYIAGTVIIIFMVAMIIVLI